MTRTIQQLFDLTGKTALVTGGSRGLGLQLAWAMWTSSSTTQAQPGEPLPKTIPWTRGTR